MTDKDKNYPLPWAEPSTDGTADKAHLLHQEVADANPPTAAAKALRIAVDGYEAFVEHRSGELTAESYEQVIKAFDEMGGRLLDDLKKMPLPQEFAEHAGPDVVYMPFLGHFIWMMLGVLAANVLPDASHAERYAWSAAFIRSWASYGIFTSASRAGLTPDQTHRLSSALSVSAPIDLGLIASTHVMRTEIAKEAKERDVDPKVVARERMDAMRAKAGETSGNTVPGEPSDDDMAF